jgi:hypothetical protein
VTKAVLTGIELAPAELVQPQFPDIEPDSVLLYAGTDL